jgi:hypothetical protein
MEIAQLKQSFLFLQFCLPYYMFAFIFAAYVAVNKVVNYDRGTIFYIKLRS